MLKVEFHCHTIYSKDCLSKLEKIISTCHDKGIDRIVITDHDRAAGAFAAKKLDPELVIVGEEVRTQEGEILAFFVKEEVPPGLPAVETIRRFREQGAFISVSHPLDPLRGWALEDLVKISPLLDAVEVFNARCFSQTYNQKAADFAKEHHLLSTVGSDAHTLFEIGRATMRLPYFEDTDSLKAALPQAKLDLRPTGPWVRASSRSAFIWKKIVKSKS